MSLGFGINHAHEFAIMESDENADKMINAFTDALNKGYDITDENVQNEIFNLLGFTLENLLPVDQKRVVDTYNKMI